MTFVWTESEKAVDRVELSELYRLARLGDKPPASLRTVFSNSMFKCFVVQTAGSSVRGRAMADGLDCAYLADVAVHPDHQGRGLGKAIISRLVGIARDHKEIPFSTPIPEQKASISPSASSPGPPPPLGTQRR